MSRISSHKKIVYPTKILRWLLYYLARDRDKVSIIGDLEEEHEEIYLSKGAFTAHLWYFLQIINSIPTFLKNGLSRSMAMFKNYFKIAIRNLRKQKIYSYVNISGLTIGMTAFILILLYVLDELSYDAYHEHADNIYRVTMEMKSQGSGKINKSALSNYPIGEALKADFPEVVEQVRFRKRDRELVKTSEKSFYEDVLFTDASLFKVFSFNLRVGNPETALQEPGTVVISDDIAKKFFGEANPIGETITVAQFGDYRITGIMENIPANSHFSFGIFPTIKSLEPHYSWMKSWFAYSFYTYVRLQPGQDFQTLARNEKFLRKYVGDDAVDVWGVNYDFQPLTDIHLRSNMNSEMTANGNITYVSIFFIAAIFVLIIACINYMNLSTSRFENRAKEVSLRKVVGARRMQLIWQFLGESIFMTLISYVLAVAAVIVLLPVYNNFIAKNIVFGIDSHFPFLLLGLGFTILLGIAAGCYPAFFLSSFRPVSILKGENSTGAKGAFFRNTLVVFQFAASITLIIGTSVVQSQLHYFTEKNLGFVKEQVVVIPLRSNEIAEKYDVYKQNISNIPEVQYASAVSAPPGENHNGRSIRAEGFNEGRSLVMNIAMTDFDYVNTFAMDIIAGRNFNKELNSDFETGFMANEAAVKLFGWSSPEAAIGKEIVYSGSKRGKIIGIVRDFNYESLRKDIHALIIHYEPGEFDFLSIKINTQDITTLLKNLENEWSAFAPGIPFEYSFLDEDFDSLYRSEMQLGKTINVFSVLSIVIACLGLFGLAAFMTLRRTKEIGVRKVLGATAPNILSLLSREFGKRVLWANVFAWPVAYYLMNNWLNGFAYRIDLSASVFVYAGLLSLILSIVTVSFHALKSALANPVTSLRYE